MKKFKIKNILVPVDFSETSENAITVAITLAKLLKANVFFIHVIEFKGYYFSVMPEMQTILPSHQDLEKAADKKTNEMSEKIRKKFGILPKVFIANGSVHSEIISYSKKEKIDLIIMGTHGISGYKDFFMGSNAQRVVTLSDIPILTMQKDSTKSKFKNILIPIDNSLHSREKVNMAMLIADLFDAKIHIIGLPGSKDKQELDELKIKLESVEKNVQSDKLPYKTSLVHGESLAQSALKYANENKCDLIVINTGHESKITGIFLGAFAQQIVNHSKVPVLSIKHTEGYYTIVTPAFGFNLY